MSEQNKQKIETLLNEWGYACGDPSWYDKKAAILRWLHNFKPSEVADAILLMEKIQYQGDNAIREAVSGLSTELKKLVID
jgi:hypothetical protein